MNVSTFRRHLQERDRKREALDREISHEIEAGRFLDAESLWSNPELNNKCEPGDLRAANVIFPDRVHLLPTSAFYDRVYVDLPYYSPSFDPIEDEVSFRRAFQMPPTDFLALVRARRVVPVFQIDLASYTDYLLEHLVFPLLTNELPHMTFQGRSLICKTWQVKNDAFPDPQSETWAFLMDLTGAMGIGANLVRPEFATDVWERRQPIFDALAFDEIAAHFVSQELTFDDFFVATGISYDSRIPIGDYLALFDQIDKAKIHALYQNLDKGSFVEEIERLNLEIKSATREVDREQVFLKVISAPIALLFYLTTGVLGDILGKEVVAGLKSMTDSEIAALIRKYRSALEEALARNWEKYRQWLNAEHSPDALELARLRRLMEKKP